MEDGMNVRTKKIVNISLLMVALCLIGIYLYDKYVNEKIDQTPSELLNDQWPKMTIGTMGLSVQIPVNLDRTEVTLPEDAQKTIEKMEIYARENYKGLTITANSIKYLSVIDSVSLAGGAIGTMNGIRDAEGVEDFQYRQENSLKNGVPGYLQRGSYKQDGKEYAFINAGYGQDLNFWQVMVLYYENSDNGKTVAERIIGSIEITVKK